MRMMKKRSVRRPPIALGVRWMVRSDLERVAEIERRRFHADCRWGRGEFARMLTECATVMRVAEHQGQVIGYIVYELAGCQFELKSIVVDREWERRGVGRQLINKLIGGLSSTLRRRIVADVSERSVDMQLFLKACGFRATTIIRNGCISGADSYLFQHWFPYDGEASRFPPF